MIATGALTLLVTWTILTSFFIVTPKSTATVTRLGRYVRTAQPGLNFKIPFFIEMVDRRLSLALLSGSETIRAKTSDNAYVDMPIEIFYEVNEDMVYEAAYNLDEPDEQIMRLAAKEVRSSVTSMELDQLFQDKERLEQEAMLALKSFVESHGWRIRNVVIDEPTPSEEIQRASNSVIASKRDQEAATNRAEAIRIERVGEAKADAEALTQRAKAFADSRETIAAGIVKAKEALSKGTSDMSDAQLVSVLEGVDMRDALISCSKGNGTVIIAGGQTGGISDTAGLIRALDKPRGEAAA